MSNFNHPPHSDGPAHRPFESGDTYQTDFDAQQAAQAKSSDSGLFAQTPLAKTPLKDVSQQDLVDTLKDPAQWPRQFIYGLIAAAVSWFIAVPIYSYHRINGVIVDCSGFDLGGFVAGAITAVFAYTTFRETKRPSGQVMSDKERYIFAGVIAALAAIHVLRAVFSIISPGC